MGHGLRFHRVCVLAMIGVAVVLSFMRARAVSDTLQAEELIRELDTMMEKKPVAGGTLEPGTIRVESSGQSFSLKLKPDTKARREEIYGELNPLASRVALATRMFLPLMIWILGFLSLPLVVSVFRSTDSSARAARLLSLCLIPMAWLFMSYGSFPASENPQASILLRLLIILAYPGMIVAVIYYVLCANSVRDMGMAFGAMLSVAVLLIGGGLAQYALPASATLHYGVWGLETVLVLGFSWLYLRADFS